MKKILSGILIFIIIFAIVMNVNFTLALDETDIDTNTNTNIETNTDVDTNIDTNTNSDSDSDSDTDTNTNSDLDLDSDSDTNSGTNTNANTDAEEEELISIKGEKSAEDGIYKIIMFTSQNKVFRILNTSNESQLEIYDSNKDNNQKFQIQYAGDGFYKIKSKESNKALTVESETPTEGSKILQQPDENLDTQKWILEKHSESIYSIISKCGNLYMELPSDSINNGAKLQLNKKTDLNEQKFILVNQTPTENIVQIEDGIYQIKATNNKVFDVAGASQKNLAKIHIWDNVKNQNQKFRITRINNTNYYKITAIHSTKAITLSSNDERLNVNIVQSDFKNTDNQYWIFKKTSDGCYNIISKSNGLYLDIANGNVNTNGTSIQTYYNNNTISQKFKLEQINIIRNNTYDIETKLSSNRVIDISGKSKKDSAKIHIWSPLNQNNQRFKFVALSDDTYKIIAKHSNKALTVNTKKNTLYQSKYTGSKNQQWKIIEKENGYYSIVNKANNRCLGVYQNKTKKGQKIKLYVKTNMASRQFKLVTGFRKFYAEGTYGKSGLAKKGDKRGTKLKYYKIGRGSKCLFATFSIHGFEDSYDHDGKELTYIAEEFKTYLKNNITEDIVNKYTIYIFPCLNPDGQVYGYTNNGPGRTTLYSCAPNKKGIDMNRNWSVGYVSQKATRNYNGTKPFQSYESRYLRNFILDHQGKSNILIDTHGWLEETMGDYSLGKYYRKKFGMSKHINAYGKGYLINWARTLKNGRSTLVELPEVTSHKQVLNRKYAKKWIDATIKMLKEN